MYAHVNDICLINLKTAKALNHAHRAAGMPYMYGSFEAGLDMNGCVASFEVVGIWNEAPAN